MEITGQSNMKKTSLDLSYQVEYKVDVSEALLIESFDTMKECREFIESNKLSDWKIIQLEYDDRTAHNLTIPSVNIDIVDQS